MSLEQPQHSRIEDIEEITTDTATGCKIVVVTEQRPGDLPNQYLDAVDARASSTTTGSLSRVIDAAIGDDPSETE